MALSVFAGSLRNPAACPGCRLADGRELDAGLRSIAAQTDKANILGALDDMHAVSQAISGAALPTLNYMRYANFLL